MLLIVSTLLALLAIASIAVVVGSRMAEQTHRVGPLKAVGGTPLLVAFVLLAENLLLALTGAAVGVTVGQLVTPVLTPGTLIAIAVLTAIPARIGAHRPVAEILRAE